MQAREAAFSALLQALQEKSYISATLENWFRKEKPSYRDFRLAQEIANGSCRMANALDAIGEALTDRKKLKLKLNERALLRTALYQACMMDRIPLYAIVNETLAIAKKHGIGSKAGFFNALLRKLEGGCPSLPSGKYPKALSVRYSYPEDFIKKILQEHGAAEALKILQCGNEPPILMARCMASSDPLKFVLLDRPETSSDLYIQNITPAFLCKHLASKMDKKPQKILDLCAAPGGKLIMAHTLFPSAKLYANDVSAEKIKKLKSNLVKYGIESKLTEGLGELYPEEEAFDMIILDVPCSNSGVFNKRPEARWRLSNAALKDLAEQQMRLIGKARKLLKTEGALWYLTCSILPEENHQLITEACQTFNFEKITEYLQLPNPDGHDGGYGALLIAT